MITFDHEQQQLHFAQTQSGLLFLLSAKENRGKKLPNLNLIFWYTNKPDLDRYLRSCLFGVCLSDDDDDDDENVELYVNRNGCWWAKVACL